MSSYRLIEKCVVSKVATQMYAVRLVNMKRITATFEAVCPECGMMHTFERKAATGVIPQPRSYVSDPRVGYTVLRYGVFTGFRVAVPIAMLSKYTEYIEIGHLKFRINHHNKTINGSDMPASWFVDISGDIPEVAAEQQAVTA
jgi:hypothetical protein